MNYKTHAHSSRQDPEPQSCLRVMPAVPPRASSLGHLLGGTRSAAAEEESGLLLPPYPSFLLAFSARGIALLSSFLFHKVPALPPLAPYAYKITRSWPKIGILEPD